MKIEIKNRFSGEVIFSHEQEENSIKITLEMARNARANLSCANLSCANLDGANLDGASLDGAYLSRANLARANLSCAYLAGANLAGANLARANLARANLDGAYLDGATYGVATLAKGLLQLLGLSWPVLIFDSHIKIGCQFHSTEEWSEFDDDKIKSMSGGALEFWNKNKSMILAMAANHQGTDKP
ncbi:MAG: pentapeptide repeat-containing protein [Methylobacter sp.]